MSIPRSPNCKQSREYHPQPSALHCDYSFGNLREQIATTLDLLWANVE